MKIMPKETEKRIYTQGGSNIDTILYMVEPNHS